jgi:(p)ppGpp synthase/HD superfamily hydrolase
VLTTRLPHFAEARPAVRRAVEWASVMHAHQRRAVDQAPFVVHPLEVAALLSGRGFDDDVVCAGVLHDVVEKTDVAGDDIERRFGVRVAALVAALTENPSIRSDSARKADLRARVAAAGADACAIYAADKVCKVREMRAQPGPVDGEKLAHYQASLEMLREAVPELALVDQLGFELWALEALPPDRA